MVKMHERIISCHHSTELKFMKQAIMLYVVCTALLSIVPATGDQ